MDETSKDRVRDVDDCVLLKKTSSLPKDIRLTEEQLNGLCKEVKHRPNPCPYIRIYDANNQNEQDVLNCNPSNPSVEVGLSFSF
jgi:hypothetical protein